MATTAQTQIIAEPGVPQIVITREFDAPRELVYRAYDGILRFDLVKIMGRMTLPAVEIARKFARERKQPGRQLDLVLFLDTMPGATEAQLRDETAFCDSAERPREFNE